MRSKIDLKYIINEIIDDLLLNKSVLLISDKYSYNEIVFELKEEFEDVPLYAFYHINENNVLPFVGISKEFDKVIVYLDSDEETERAKTILEKEILIF